MRRTRILCTVGPATEAPDRIRALIDAGADVIRLNFSHGTTQWHAEMCRRIRRAAADAGRFVAVLQDLSGPKDTDRRGDVADRARAWRHADDRTR
jgi:pyruvate kinase